MPSAQFMIRKRFGIRCLDSVTTFGLWGKIRRSPSRAQPLSAWRTRPANTRHQTLTNFLPGEDVSPVFHRSFCADALLTSVFAVIHRLPAANHARTVMSDSFKNWRRFQIERWKFGICRAWRRCVAALLGATNKHGHFIHRLGTKNRLQLIAWMHNYQLRITTLSPDEVRSMHVDFTSMRRS